MCVCSYHVHTPMNLHILSHITQKHTYPNMHAAHSCPQTERETHKQDPAMYTPCTHLHVLTCASIQAHSHPHACRTQKYSHRYTYTSTQTTTNISVHARAHSCTNTQTHAAQTHACTQLYKPGHTLHTNTHGAQLYAHCAQRDSHICPDEAHSSGTHPTYTQHTCVYKYM